jgi:aminopeptidase N
VSGEKKQRLEIYSLSFVFSANNISITYFEDTPPIPAYTVAFVVTDLPYISDGNQRVFGRLAAIAEESVSFALEAAVQISKALQKNFNLKPALKKVDHVALPTFHVDSVENFGLPKYRETSLFYNPETSPLNQKFNVSI